MPSELWMPGGTAIKKDQIPISLQELRAASAFHEFAARHKLMVVCPKCDRSVQGSNDGNSQTASIACGCREWIYRQP